jgi:DNA-binding NtrC family response regulator
MKPRLPRVLAIDDDSVWLDQLVLVLEDQCEVSQCTSVDAGIRAVESQFYDIVLLDLNFDGDERTGIEVFKHIHAADQGADVIVVSGETRPDRLVQILNAGVTQFIAKPATPDDVRNSVRKTLQQREARLRAINLAQSEGLNGQVHLIGSSPQMERLREQIDRVIRDGTKDILVTGETGTGKEIVARTIAALADPSRRLLPIHCGAISDGIAESELFGHVRGAFTGADRDRASAFETVGGGFVFFDEIGDMPLNQQAKLLRVLQERKVQRVGSVEERTVNFRSISATNVDLQLAIGEKRFRADLFYRVAKEVIHIHPLRDRIEDISDLVEFFLAQASSRQRKTITQEAIEMLKAYDWPGNIRELRSVIESIENRCREKVIRERDVLQVLPLLEGVLKTRFTRSMVGQYGSSLIDLERRKYLKAISDANGNRDQAAKTLKVSRATFFRRAKELGIVRSRMNSNLVDGAVS